MNYSILKELGHGGMATVYLAEDKKFQTQVALKVLNKDLANNENIRKRFLAEARNMYKMSHPNIIKVTDLIEEGDTVAFVMEHIDGETLKEYLDRKGKLSETEIKKIFSQILEAVGYVHKKGLIHRDIKPSNFMIDKEGNVKLLDFGIAKNTDSSAAEYTSTGTGMQMGTPMYMSPEQVKSTKEVTFQSDIYSLGVVLWQLVTGTKPYDQHTLSIPEIQVSILKEPLPKTNTSFDPVLAKATEKEPSNRYTDADAFLSALQNKSTDTEKTVLNIPEEKTIIEKKETPIIINANSNQKVKSDTNKTQKNTEKKNNIPRIILFSAIGLLAILIICFYVFSSGVSAVPEWKTLDGTNYSVQYPSDWELNENGQMGTKFILISPLENDKDQFRENVNLIEMDIAPPEDTSGNYIDLDKYVEISQKEVKKSISNSVIVESTRMKTSNPEYHKLIYSGYQNNNHLMFEQYVWVHNNMIYVITLTCEFSKFSDYKETGEKILNSFLFKKL